MQKPGRAALPPASSVYTDDQVLSQLLRGSAAETWTFDLLDADMTQIGDLTPHVQLSNSTLSVDTTRDVQAVLTMTTIGNQVDDLSYLIRPHYRIVMPDGGVADFTLGIFNWLPAGKNIYRGYTLNSLSCSDSAQILTDDEIEYAAGIGAGTSYLQAITSVVESYGGRTPIPVMIPDSGKRLPAALSWNAGTSRISIVNALLSAQNYYPAWFDERGNLRSSPIPDYRTVSESASFDTTADAIVPGMTTQPQFANIYNAFLLTLQNPATSTSSSSTSSGASSTAAGLGLYAYYENRDPASPISIPRWGHKKLHQWQDSAIADVGTARAACITAAQVCERIFAPITFNTPCWPLSQSNDIYRLHIDAQDEGETDELYIETQWSMSMVSGAVTSHTFEQISFASTVGALS